MLGNPPVGLNRGRVHREENVGLDYRWHREIPAPPGTRFPKQKVGTIEESTIFPFIRGVADMYRYLASLWIRIQIQGFDDQKFKKFPAKNFSVLFFWLEIAIYRYFRYLSLGLHTRRQSYGRGLEPSKKNIQRF